MCYIMSFMLHTASSLRICITSCFIYNKLVMYVKTLQSDAYFQQAELLKPHFTRFQLECPMPIALRAPSRICPRSGLEYVKVCSPQHLAAALRGRPSKAVDIQSLQGARSTAMCHVIRLRRTAGRSAAHVVVGSDDGCGCTAMAVGSTWPASRSKYIAAK